MNREMICGWLGLAEKRWPPDPYALLGLSPTDCDAPRIELRVQERMAKLRCYQLSHPDEATEGMNRVAQAFICLIERHGAPLAPRPPVKKQALPETTGSAALPAARGLGDTDTVRQTRTDWEAAPPPVRAVKKMPLPAVPVDEPQPAVATPAQEELPAPVETEDQVVHGLAEESPEAREDLVTLQAVMQRADITRQLLIAWRNAGHYLATPRRKLVRASDKSDFSQRLEELLEASENFPTFVAHPGRPGYRAVALAYLGITPEVFNAMGDEPRQQLARDWSIAHKILLVHRRFLLRHFKSLRQRGLFGRATHTLQTSINNHPVLWTGFAAGAGVTVLVLIAILMILS